VAVKISDRLPNICINDILSNVTSPVSLTGIYMIHYWQLLWAS